MADVMACLVADGDHFVVDEQRLLNVIHSSKSSSNVNLPQPPQAFPANRKRSPMGPMVSNEENFVPKRKYAPPPPPPTTKAKVEPTTPSTAGSSNDVEPAFGQFMRMMTELIKREAKEEDKQGTDAKENVDEILNLE